MTVFSSLPPAVRLMEVGPRDGLQNESVVVDTATKVAFIEGLVDAGVKRIEITAFVNPRWIPPLADHAEVARAVAARKKPGVVYAALTPNTKGYESAQAAGVDEAALFLAATDSHNKKNINATTEEALQRYVEVAGRARADKMPFRAYVSCALGCPYEGEVAPEKVVRVAEQMLALGAYEISIGDTIGMGDPLHTARLVRALAKSIPLDKIALHLHDTRGTALANITAALDEGVRSFDSSAGGLGGCPYAPGASGNVATEDLVWMLHAMGIQTGIDLDAFAATTLKLEGVLGRQLPSRILAVKRGASTGAAA